MVTPALVQCVPGILRAAAGADNCMYMYMVNAINCLWTFEFYKENWEQIFILTVIKYSGKINTFKKMYTIISSIHEMFFLTTIITVGTHFQRPKIK